MGYPVKRGAAVAAAEEVFATEKAKVAQRGGETS
jgi:hypothetical protein